MIALSPAAGEAVFADPAMVGAWAAELPKMLDGPQSPPWCSYLARRDGRPVGMGGFKGPPDGAGWVEIGYHTFLPSQRSGVATGVAALLVEIAGAAGSAGVRAATLPAHNPSTRVLEANGFVCLGAAMDPDDGEVWRWERRLAEWEGRAA